MSAALSHKATLEKSEVSNTSLLNDLENIYNKCALPTEQKICYIVYQTEDENEEKKDVFYVK